MNSTETPFYMKFVSEKLDQPANIESLRFLHDVVTVLNPGTLKIGTTYNSMLKGLARNASLRVIKNTYIADDLLRIAPIRLSTTKSREKLVQEIEDLKKKLAKSGKLKQNPRVIKALEQKLKQLEGKLSGLEQKF